MIFALAVGMMCDDTLFLGVVEGGVVGKECRHGSDNAGSMDSAAYVLESGYTNYFSSLIIVFSSTLSSRLRGLRFDIRDSSLFHPNL